MSLYGAVDVDVRCTTSGCDGMVRVFDVADMDDAVCERCEGDDGR